MSPQQPASQTKRLSLNNPQANLGVQSISQLFTHIYG